MSRIQREILIWYALAIALTCIWVPWRGPVSDNLTAFLGYASVWAGPNGDRGPEYYQLATIDYGRMALEFLGLTAVFGIAFLVTPERTVVPTVVDKPSRPETPLPRQTLPYNWGKFQGWVSFVVGLFAAVFAPVAVATKDERAVALAMASPLLIASGYAFARRKKFAVTMTYAWIVFYVLVFISYVIEALTNKLLSAEQRGEIIGKGVGTLVIGVTFWSLCALYYRKRQSEFS